jgi:hypothetical protein
MRCRAVVGGLVALAVAAGVATQSTAAEAEDGFTTLGAQQIAQGQRAITITAAQRFFPSVVRVTSGSCDTPVDEAVVLEGVLTRDDVGLASGILSPIGAPARTLAQDSAFNADVGAELAIATVDVSPTPFKFAVVGITIHVNRENGFPGVRAFTVCVRQGSTLAGELP